MLKKALSEFLYRKYNHSFSQGGEDVILANLFSGKAKGFFVDIGAFHPYRLSNTYLFYKKGWNGINIDAAPGSMKIFNELRPRDINVEAAISEHKEMLTYYYLGERNSMNTFSKEFLEKMGAMDMVAKQIPITTQRLEDIIAKHAGGKEINFMSVDVEGLEISVLQSNNWDKFRPHIILLESFELFNDQCNYDLELKDFLYGKGYKVVCKTTNCIYFVRSDMEFNAYNHINY